MHLTHNRLFSLELERENSSSPPLSRQPALPFRPTAQKRAAAPLPSTVRPSTTPSAQDAVPATRLPLSRRLHQFPAIHFPNALPACSTASPPPLPLPLRRLRPRTVLLAIPLGRTTRVRFPSSLLLCQPPLCRHIHSPCPQPHLPYSPALRRVSAVVERPELQQRRRLPSFSPTSPTTTPLPNLASKPLPRFVPVALSHRVVDGSVPTSQRRPSLSTGVTRRAGKRCSRCASSYLSSVPPSLLTLMARRTHRRARASPL